MKVNECFCLLIFLVILSFFERGERLRVMCSGGDLDCDICIYVYCVDLKCYKALHGPR